MQPYTAQYRSTLLHRSASKILKLLTLCFLLYLLMKVLSVYLNLESIESLEREHLLGASTRMKSKMNSEYLKSRMLINMIRETFEIKITKGQGGELIGMCQQDVYICQLSDIGTIEQVKYHRYLVENQYHYLNSLQNQYLMVLNTAKKQKLVYRLPNQTSNIDQSSVELTADYLNSIVNYITSNYASSNEYIDIDMFFSDTIVFRIRCGTIKSPFLGKNCLIVHFPLPTIQQTQTYLLIRNLNSVVSPSATSTKLWSLTQFVSAHISYMFLKQYSSSTVQPTTLSAFINLSVKSNPNLSIIKAYQSGFLHYLQYPIFIGHFNIFDTGNYYTDLVETVEKQKEYVGHYIVLSPEEYFNKRDLLILKALEEIEIVGRVVLIMAVLWVVALGYSQTYIGGLLVPNLNFVMKLADIIITTCKEQQNTNQNWNRQFDKILSNAKITLFQSTIKYFKAFVWCRKITDNGINTQKRTNLLLQGLQLFTSTDYTPVLNFIYKEIIVLQQQHIAKLKKMRYFGRKSQSDERVPSKTFKCRKDGILISQQQPYSLKQIIQTKKEIVSSNKQSDSQSYIHFEKPQVMYLAIQRHYKSKRGVRFSSETQVRELQTTKLIKRKSRFPRLQLQNKQSSNKPSQKSIENNDIKSRSQTEIEDIVQDQKSIQISQKIKKDRNKLAENTLKNLLAQQEQEQISGLSGFKFDQVTQEQQGCSQQMSQMATHQLSTQQLQDLISLSYVRIVNYYESLIVILKSNFEHTPNQIDSKKTINQIYQFQVDKLRYLYKLYKHKKIIDSTFDPNQVDINFDIFTTYENLYEIQHHLVQKAEVYKMKVYKVLDYPFCYRQLENLCNSQDGTIRAEAKHLFAAQFVKMEPHFDLQVINRLQQNLTQTETNSKYKRKELSIMQQVISKHPQFQKQYQDLQLIRRFYNYNYKKFYFIADVSQVYDAFTPFLKKVYECIDRLDLFRLFNLNYSESEEDYLGRGVEEIKPKRVQVFQAMFQELNEDSSKLKSKTSTKTLNKKLIYQRDFNTILSKIEQDPTQFSKYLVIILGGDNQSSHSMVTDEADSSSYQNYRQIHQLLHGQIMKKMEKNYFHVLLVGTHLSSYQTKQGKLKKYAKQSHDYLEVDLNKKTWPAHSKEIEKYLIK